VLSRPPGKYGRIGEEKRKRIQEIKDKAKEATDAAKDKAESAKEATGGFFSNLRQRVFGGAKDLAHKAKEDFEGKQMYEEKQLFDELKKHNIIGKDVEFSEDKADFIRSLFGRHTAAPSASSSSLFPSPVVMDDKAWESFAADVKAEMLVQEMRGMGENVVSQVLRKLEYEKTHHVSSTDKTTTKSR